MSWSLHCKIIYMAFNIWLNYFTVIAGGTGRKPQSQTEGNTCWQPEVHIGSTPSTGVKCEAIRPELPSLRLHVLPPSPVSKFSWNKQQLYVKTTVNILHFPESSKLKKIGDSRRKENDRSHREREAPRTALFLHDFAGCGKNNLKDFMHCCNSCDFAFSVDLGWMPHFFVDLGIWHHSLSTWHLRLPNGHF